MTLMLTGVRMSIQAELAVFFGHLRDRPQLVRTVSEHAFAQAGAKLSLTSIPSLNGWLVARAEQYGFVPRWRRSASSPPTHRPCASACARATSSAPRCLGHLVG